MTTVPITIDPTSAFDDLADRRRRPAPGRWPAVTMPSTGRSRARAGSPGRGASEDSRGNGPAPDGPDLPPAGGGLALPAPVEGPPTAAVAHAQDRPQPHGPDGPDGPPSQGAPRASHLADLEAQHAETVALIAEASPGQQAILRLFRPDLDFRAGAWDAIARPEPVAGRLHPAGQGAAANDPGGPAQTASSPLPPARAA